MKIRSVRQNNRKHAFEVATWRHHLLFPYAKADPTPTAADPPVDVSVDDELGREGFTYRLASGREGSVHVEQVLDYNQDPGYLRDLLLYRLTIEAQRRLDVSSPSRSGRSSVGWAHLRRSSTACWTRPTTASPSTRSSCCSTSSGAMSTWSSAREARRRLKGTAGRCSALARPAGEPLLTSGAR